MWEILVFTALLVVTYFTGSWVEKKHFQSLIERETAQAKIPVLSVNIKDLGAEVRSVSLVAGSAVVAADFFKSKLAALVSIFGGNIPALESVIERARREAMLRLREEAKGADYICGVQYETCFLEEQQKKAMPNVEVLVYANAIFLHK